jgi:hypothetical protein
MLIFGLRVIPKTVSHANPLLHHYLFFNGGFYVGTPQSAGHVHLTPQVRF